MLEFRGTLALAKVAQQFIESVVADLQRNDFGDHFTLPVA
jgi:hypothetical protein